MSFYDLVDVLNVLILHLNDIVAKFDHLLLFFLEIDMQLCFFFNQDRNLLIEVVHTALHRHKKLLRL